MPSVFFVTSASGVVRASRIIRSRVLDARDPDLLAVDDVAVAASHGGGLELGGVGAGGRLGHAQRLQPQLAAGDLRQVALLLLRRAVAQQRAHVVHLAVAGAGVAAAAVDLLHDDARLRRGRGPSRRTRSGSAPPASRLRSARRRTSPGSRAPRRSCGSIRRGTRRTARARRRGYPGSGRVRSSAWRNLGRGSGDASARSLHRQRAIGVARPQREAALAVAACRTP